MYVSLAKSQVCVPDPSLTSTGIFPAELPYAMAGYLYWTTLSFYVPKDSSIVFGNTTIPVTVDSTKFIYSTGRPPGFDFECNTPGCVWKGGSRGCALFKGKVDSLFVDSTLAYREFPMKIYTMTWARFQGGTDPLSRIDSATNYIFRIRKYNNVAEILKYTPLTAYPNPTNGTVNIELRNLNNEINEVSITDVFGKCVFQRSFSKPDQFLQTYTADLTGYAPGLYFVTLKSGNQSGIAKVQLK